MKPANWPVPVLGDSCASCRRAGVPLCRVCEGELVPAPAGPLPEGASRVTAAWAYSGPARALVLALKERGRRTCAGPLAAAAAAAVWRAGCGATLITWVPGRPGDRRRRGFDHAELLAGALGDRLGLPVAPLLRRIRPVRDQVGLSGEERRANLAGAFGARRTVPPRVALVDDVLTTGATAASCAAALRHGGATVVEVVVPCRTP